MRRLVVEINKPQCYAPNIVWISGKPYSETTDMIQEASGVVFVRNKIYEELPMREEQ